MIALVLAASGLLLLLSLWIESWVLLLLSLLIASFPLAEILLGLAILSLQEVRWFPSDHELVRMLRGLSPPRWRLKLGVKPGPPDAFAVQTGLRSGAVVLTAGMLDLLSEGELEAVLAHEICHLVEHHSMVRIVALVLSLMNIPIGTAAGAALSRRLEYRADEFSVVVTGKPIQLASALVKVAMARAGNSFLVSKFSPSLRRILGLFSWSPSLESRLRRIERISYRLLST